MITVLFGGSRPQGNTAQLTQYALEGKQYNWIDLTQYHFKPVRDYRHESKQIESYIDDYQLIIDQVLESDTVIFASPVYWYSVSAVSYTHLTLPTTLSTCRSRWSPYH